MTENRGGDRDRAFISTALLPGNHVTTALLVLVSISDSQVRNLMEATMFLKRALMAGAMVLTTAIAANAADLTPITPAPPPAPPPAPTFNWAGPYVGAYGGFVFGPGAIQAGAQAGYNFVSGGFLGGIEIQAGVFAPIPGVTFEADLNARVGAVLGGNFLLYGEAGVGWLAAPGAFIYTFGGGAEVAVGTSVSLFGEVKGLGAFGGGCCIITVQGGLNYHF
jgi:opacity protein-like surface antigen